MLICCPVAIAAAVWRRIATISSAVFQLGSRLGMAVLPVLQIIPHSVWFLRAAKKYSAFLASDSVIKQIPRLLGPGLNKAGKFPTLIGPNDNLETKVSLRRHVWASAGVRIQCYPGDNAFSHPWPFASVGGAETRP